MLKTEPIDTWLKSYFLATNILEKSIPCSWLASSLWGISNVNTIYLVWLICSEIRRTLQNNNLNIDWMIEMSLHEFT